VKRGVVRAARAAAVLLAIGVVTAPRFLKGRTFGRLVERALPAMSGQVRVGGGRWSWSAVLALWRERPAPFVLEDVRVLAVGGAEVLRVGRLSGSLELRRGERRAIVRDLVVDGATWRMDDAGDGAGIRLLAAFRPPRRVGTGGGGPAFRVSVPNARLEKVNAIFDLPPWGLTLGDVEAVASLALGDGAPGAAGFTFEVRAARARDGGRLRLGPVTAPWTLPFSSARLDRVATTREAPDAIRVEASEVVTGASSLALAATFEHVYGLEGPKARPGLALAATLEHAPDALRALLASHEGSWRPSSLDGPRAALSLGLEGPYENLAVTAEARGFEVGSHGVRLEELGFRLAATPAEGRTRVEGLSASWRGVGRFQGGAAVDVDKKGGAIVREVSLIFARPPTSGSPFVVGLRSRKTRAPRGAPAADATLAVSNVAYRDGALALDGLRVPLWDGEVVAKGKITVVDAKSGRWLTSPRVDLSLDATRLDVTRALAGNFVRGVLSFHARARGLLWDPTLDLTFPRDATVTILGDELAIPPKLSFLLTNGLVFLHVPLKRRGGGGLTASGQIALTGPLKLEVEVDDFPLGRLPGLADTGLGVEGLLWGKLHVAGAVDAPLVSGRLDTGVVAIHGHKLGDGSVTIATDRAGTLHAQGQLFGGVHIDGTLRAERAGPRGEVKIALHELGAETFAFSPPGGFELRGAVSGSLVARIAPHQPSTIDGVLSDVRLDVRQPRVRGASASTASVGLRAVSPVPVALRSDGAASFGPARFAGAAGTFEVGVERRGATSRSALRGRLDLAALSPLLAPWLRNPRGAVEVDLAASAGAHTPLTVDGTASVATPLSFALVDQPLRASVRGGRARFDGLAADVRELDATISLDVAALAPGAPVSTVAGSLRVSGRVVRDASGATLDARADLGHLELAVPMLGESPAVADGGFVEVRGAADALGLDDIFDLDLPLRGVAMHVTTPAGVVRRARYDLRLRGRPSSTLTLAGDVEVLSAQLRRSSTATLARPGAPAERISLRNPRLDVRIHARGGAVEVELANAPDLHVDLDVHATGTLAHPVLAGAPRPAGLYSAIVMGLARLVGAGH
jgi:hypothetical protein